MGDHAGRVDAGGLKFSLQVGDLRSQVVNFRHDMRWDM